MNNIKENQIISNFNQFKKFYKFKKYSMKEKVFSITLLFLFTSFIFDPTGDFFNLKYISVFFCIIVFGLNFLINYRKIKFSKIQVFYIFTFCIFIPVYGLSLTILNANLSNFTDTSYLGFAFTLFLLIPILNISKDIFIKVLIMSLRILSLLIFMILISFLIDGDSIGMSQFFIDHKTMLMGFREYSEITTYYIYFTASPLLLILVAYDSYSIINKFTIKKFLFIISSIIATFLSGTRFNMLSAILIFPVALIFNKYTLKQILINFVFFLGFIFLISTIKFTSSFFSSNDDSNNTKIGYLESYKSILGNPKFLILGQGFNAHYWSGDFKALMAKSENDGTKTELTYLEFIRVFGLVFGLILNILIFIIPILLYRVYKEFNFLVTGILIYLFSSAINPYLFSTNGVLIFLLFLIAITNTYKFNLKNV